MSLQSRTLQLQSPNGSGYGGEWIFKPQRGWMFHNFDIITNIVNRSTLRKITLTIGSTPIVEITSVQLAVLDAMYNRKVTPGRYSLRLADFTQRLPLGIHVTSLKTSGADDITLSVEFNEKHATDPAVLAVRGIAKVSTNPDAGVINGGRQAVPTSFEIKPFVAAAGDYDYVVQSGSARLLYQRMLFDESETEIKRIKVRRGNLLLHEVTRDDLNHELEEAGITLVDGYCLLDFSPFGFAGEDAQQTAGLNFILECTSAGALKTFVQGYELV